MLGPELWGECKKLCSDCPYKTEETAKEECIHPWREVVDGWLRISDDQTVPSYVIKLCQELGASVSQHLIEGGKRSSIQITAVEPEPKPAYNRFKFVN